LLDSQLKIIDTALRQRSFALLKDSHNTNFIGELEVRSIPKIEEVVKLIVGSSDILYGKKTKSEKINREVMSSTEVGDKFLRAFTFDVDKIKTLLMGNTFNPYFKVFDECTNKFELRIRFESHKLFVDDELNAWIEDLNTCIALIRQECREKGFLKEIKSLQRGLNKNYQSLLEYIDALFACHSRILVLRIDFGYLRDAGFGKDFKEPIEFSEFKSHHDLLIKHLKSKNFKELKESFLGYASKFEYGIEKGYHFHSFIFLDGSLVREDVSLGKLIGNYWNTTLTKGSGVYHNCNARKDSYQYPGVGMISHNDDQLMDGLKNHAAPYLTKMDYYIKLIAPKGQRTFVKGITPKPKKDARGRPRSKVTRAPKTRVERMFPLPLEIKG
jgi:hypothetical protein